MNLTDNRAVMLGRIANGATPISPYRDTREQSRTFNELRRAKMILSKDGGWSLSLTGRAALDAYEGAANEVEAEITRAIRRLRIQHR